MNSTPNRARNRAQPNGGAAEHDVARNRSSGRSIAATATPMHLIRGPALVGYLIILVFFAGFGTWAALADIASATVARGVVSPEGRLKTVQHLEGGIITKILVDEGDEVQAGDPVVVLQETQARASFEELQIRKYVLAAQLARLLSEQAGRDEILFPGWLLEASAADGEVSEVLQAQQDLFAARRDVHHGRKAIGNKRIDELEEEIKGLESLSGTKRRQLVSLDEELKANEALLERDLIPRPVYLELDRLKAEIEGELAESVANMARARQTIGETELQIINEDSRRLDDIVSELADTRVELAAVDDRLNAQRDILQRTVIQAPVAGTVHNKRFYTTGGVIQPGQPILDIVPNEVELLIEARVRPVDIDVVAAGQEARVNFLSFTARYLPQIKGIVQSVSADSLRDEVTGESYYRAFVEVPNEEMEKLGDALRINAGMPAEVLIMTGKRTMLQYLMEPLVESVRRSFRED